MDTNLAPWLIIALAISLLGIILFLAGMTVGTMLGRKRVVPPVNQPDNQQIVSPGASNDLDKLAGVGRAILGAELSLDALCEVVYQQALRVVDTSDFQLGLFDGPDYVIKIWVRKGDRLLEQRYNDAANSGLIGWLRQSMQGLRVSDFQREWDSLPAKPNYESPDPPRSAVFVPLIAAGNVLGVLAVYSDEPEAFSEEAFQLLTVLSNQAAGAIRNAQLYEQTSQRADQLRLISEVTRQITAVQPLPNLFKQIVTLIHDTFSYYAVNIFTCDEQTGEAKLRASSHQEFDRRSVSVSRGEGLVGLAWKEASTVNSPSVMQDSRYLHHMVLDQTRSEITVPLIIDKRVLGILDVQSNELNAFKTEHVFTLESLAGQLALALQEAQTYDSEHRQAERINAMSEASRAVVSILDINDLLDQVVDLVADYFGYDRVHLFLRSGDQVVFRSGSGVHSGKWAIQHLSYQIEDKGFIPWVAGNAEALVSGDVEHDERYVTGPGLEDSRSEMTIPICMGTRVLGVFDIQSTLPNAFGAEDVRLVQTLSDTVAIGLRNAGLFATEKRRRMLAETLREISTVLASSLDLPSVLDGILLGLERVVDYEAAMIFLREEDESLYTLSALRGTAEVATLLGITVPADTKITEHIETLLHQIEAPDDALPPLHDHLYVGLQVGGKDIGVLGIDRLGANHFSPEDVEIINTFASQASVAIANAQLYMAQKEEAWISSALLQVAEATGRSTNLDDVLSTVARITPLLAGVEWCAVFLAAKDTFRIVEIEGIDAQLSGPLKGYTFKDADWEPFVRLRQGGRPVVINPNTLPPMRTPVQLPIINHAVLLPLHAKGSVMGAMLIGQQANGELMTDRKIELVSGIANQAALAIEGAQLFAAQQEEAWVITALLSVAESLNTTLGLEPTLNTVVRLVPMLVGVGRCGVMQWHAESRRFVGAAVWGLLPQAERTFVGLSLLAADHTYLELLATTNEPVASDSKTEHRLPDALGTLFETPDLLGLQLTAKGTLLGVMLVDYVAPGEAFDQRHMNILTGTAQQVALAMEAALLQDEATEREGLERELDVARGIQESFLPQQVPSLPGWELAAFYRAARQVGGDFYDFIPLKSGKWGIVIADVADKGVPAALFMALSRTNIRAVAFSRENAKGTLERVNELLLSDSRSDLFVTAWYGIWDPATGEIVYASAGHNPPLIVRSDGMAEELSARGIALGVIQPIRLEEKRITLMAGDVLVPYTDGVTEALSSGGAEFGVAGLQSTAASVRHRPAEEIRQHIAEELDRFTVGEAQFDDLTFIVLKRDPVNAATSAAVEGESSSPKIS